MNLTLDVKQAGGENQSLESILTREMDPWKPRHVKRILKEVTFGWEITEAEHDVA